MKCIMSTLVVMFMLVLEVHGQSMQSQTKLSKERKRPALPPTEKLKNFRSYDGTGNNEQNPSWGAANSPLIRKSGVAYPGDGSGATIFAEPERPNPREISNKLLAQDIEIPNRRGLSDFIWQWGQFLDHDLDLTLTSADNGTTNIPVNDPEDELAPLIPFNRSNFVEGTGTVGVPRQQVNVLSAFIDASQVYGSSKEVADSLRSFEGGKLKSSAEGKLLPVNENNMFLAGDIRVNEQVGLICMHTLFMREHNRLADLIATTIPDYTDEDIYQLARKLVGAEMQVITYHEFLPALLGPYAPSPHGARSYDSKVNPSIASEFSTAFFRFGHSMLSPQLLLVNNQRETVDDIALLDSFFKPQFITENPERVDLLLLGLATQQAQELDNKVIDDVRNFLFGAPGAGGLDLPALNIQRGRDHGLPDFNTIREAYGLKKISRFDQLGSDAAAHQVLEELYGSVDKIDPWVGGLVESNGGSRRLTAGITISSILREQFERLRVGDRYYYKRDVELNKPWVRRILDVDQVNLAGIIKRNTSILRLQKNVFFVE